MSIPKEPRQLMINLMYLVLIAMLALNVSAEIINAFFALDKGNKESIVTMDNQLDETQKGLVKLLNDDAKAEFRPILPAVERVRQLSTDFNQYVEEWRGTLIDAAGNNDGELNDEDYIEDHGSLKPKGKKNKDVTTRLLVDQGGGEELKARILETRTQMLETFTQLVQEYGNEVFGLSEEEIQNTIASMESNLTLNVDDTEWQESEDKKSWSEFKFKQMPLAAVLPILSKMQADATTSEAALVNKMAEFSGGRVVEFDAFVPVVSAKKSYVIAGEPFEADISVGTYSSQIDPSDISISVNGSNLEVGDDGKANYSTRTSSTGVKTLNLKVAVRNPLTGEVVEGEDTYQYEVGRRSVAVSADKMNVFYIGVDNPVSVSAAGVSTNDLQVSGTGGGINMRRTNTGKYNVTVSQPGDAKVVVSGGGLERTTFDFRVKRIPDPVPRLGNLDGGSVPNGTFKAQGGLIAWLDDFDFDARCEIQGYNLVRVPKRQDAIQSMNPGASYNSTSQRLAQAATPGDIYYFENIKARCPGDKAGRPLPSIAFQIK